jgi:hypothetical protein
MSGRSVRERLGQENEAPPLRVVERAEEARRLRRHTPAARPSHWSERVHGAPVRVYEQSR